MVFRDHTVIIKTLKSLRTGFHGRFNFDSNLGRLVMVNNRLN